jgi:hypothetical protein
VFEPVLLLLLLLLAWLQVMEYCEGGTLASAVRAGLWAPVLSLLLLLLPRLQGMEYCEGGALTSAVQVVPLTHHLLLLLLPWLQVMEYCEGGMLASAVRAGLMHETSVLNGRTVVSVTMWKLLTVRAVRLESSILWHMAVVLCWGALVSVIMWKLLLTVRCWLLADWNKCACVYEPQLVTMLFSVPLLPPGMPASCGSLQ